MLLRNLLPEDARLTPSLYIHIPFCQSRCAYCDFYSTTLGRDVMLRYAHALEHEMLLRKEEAGTEAVSTRVHSLYIGGGTPSLLPTNVLTSIIAAVGRHFIIPSTAEVTVEANPDDVTQQWLEAVASTPVNRISMGVQTFRDHLLRLIGRRHTAQQAIRAVKLCREAGIGNVSIDLIYGLPGQTLEDWQADVDQALGLGVTHLSAYALSYEEGTRLSDMLCRGLIQEADEELSRQMYDLLIDATARAGFMHYEISNFALPGFQSRHNSSYWQGRPYLGFGAGAHSYDGHRIRRANLSDVKAYTAATHDVPHQTETLTDDECYDEFIMTRLRTADGISLDELTPDDRRYCLDMAAPHLTRGNLNIQHAHLCLTRQGIFTSNDIISDLMK